jgi:hypothetical protein
MRAEDTRAHAHEHANMRSREIKEEGFKKKKKKRRTGKQA